MSIFSQLKPNNNKLKARRDNNIKYDKYSNTVPVDVLWSYDESKRIDEENKSRIIKNSRIMRQLSKDLLEALNHSHEIEAMIDFYNIGKKGAYKGWKSVVGDVWMYGDEFHSKIKRRDTLIRIKVKVDPNRQHIPTYALPTGYELMKTNVVKRVVSTYEDEVILKDIVDNDNQYEFRFEVRNQNQPMVNPYDAYNQIKIDDKQHKTPVLLGESNSGYPIIWDLNRCANILLSGDKESKYQQMVKDIIVSLRLLNSVKDLNISIASDNSVYKSLKNNNYIDEMTDDKLDIDMIIRRKDQILNANCKDIEDYNDIMRETEKPIMKKEVIIVDSSKYLKKHSDTICEMMKMQCHKLGVYFIIAVGDRNDITPILLSNMPSRIAMAMDDASLSTLVLGHEEGVNIRLGGEFLTESSIAGVKSDTLGQQLNIDDNIIKRMNDYMNHK